MTDLSLGYCSWCGDLMLSVHKITHIYIGAEPNQYYLKTMHSLCCDEEWEFHAPVRDMIKKMQEASFKAWDEYLSGGSK